MPHVRAPRDAAGDRHLGGDGRCTKRGGWLDAELSLEELGGHLHLTRRGIRVARCTQTPDQEDMGVLVVGVEPNELGGVVDGGSRFTAREESERRLMEHRARHPHDMTALVLEPYLEAGARTEHQPVQQLVPEAGKRGGLHPGAPGEHIDVNQRPRQQRQPERISAQLGMLAHLAAQHREGPAKRSQWVIRLREQQARHPFARRWNLAAKEEREQAPCLMATQRPQTDAAPLHPWRSQEMDAQPHLIRPPSHALQ